METTTKKSKFKKGVKQVKNIAKPTTGKRLKELIKKITS